MLPYRYLFYARVDLNRTPNAGCVFWPGWMDPPEQRR